ncbi:ATP-dependent DNA helicase RecQ-like [Hydractinia symbiolongicarpus]|uniref:ATP-dependent DNA helicase RecQ-like n=1 Tax=Hydractinia symbiolongicarpus TaxID=13093 RepID=UPI00254C0B5D|nr:ATP-dependent DNA helicase RecQ-like [Hydractinia symbiolongicarpus]
MDVLKRLDFVFNLHEGFPSHCFKPKQVQCFEALLKEDQVQFLNSVGISAMSLHCNNSSTSSYESLFAEMKTHEEINISKKVQEGDINLLFAHPEAILSEQGRNLLKSTVYQDNVVGIVIDEAHCVEFWGEEFRKDFKELSTVRTYFPKASPHHITSLVKSLNMSTAKVIRVNPNRKNIFLDKKIRKSNASGFESYENILLPIANSLNSVREQFPMTIIYMKLKYCGLAFNLFERILSTFQYVGFEKTPSSRLFCQYHAPQTKAMKQIIIKEISKKNSWIRVIFATTALGMGVNISHVEDVYHITPPSNLEAYVQEIGRAGRSEQPATAILFYNNSDVSANKTNVDKNMKLYCQTSTCLREHIQKHFGFKHELQEKCCLICEKVELVEKPTTVRTRLTAKLRNELNKELCMALSNISEENSIFLFGTPKELAADICYTSSQSNTGTPDLSMLHENIAKEVQNILSKKKPIQNHHK